MNWIFRKVTLASLLFIFWVQAIASAGPCGDYCFTSTVKSQVDSVCHSLGKGLVYVPNPPNSDTWCYCQCSCVAGETLVRIDVNKFKRMQDITPGESVLAMQADGSWKTAPVISSEGTGDANSKNPYSIYVTTTDGKEIVVTADHLFLTSEKNLKRADTLTLEDKLILAKSGAPIGLKIVTYGEYHGPMWNIVVTSVQEPITNNGHLIDTAGLISADLALQRKLTSDLRASAPQIGSTAYQITNKSFI